MMSVELHVNTREDLRPDPEFDAVSAILYSVHTDANPDEMSTGVIIVANGTDSGGQVCHFYQYVTRVLRLFTFFS